MVLHFERILEVLHDFLFVCDGEPADNLVVWSGVQITACAVKVWRAGVL